MKKIWKKKNKKYTLLLVPQNADGTKRICLNTRLLISIAAGVLIFIFASFAVSYLFCKSQGDIKKVNALKASNSEQTATIRNLGKELERLEAQQLLIEEKQTMLKEMMGISTEGNAETTPSRGGQGGQELVYNGQENMDELERAQWMKTELDRQEKEIDELLARVNHDLEYFRSIPNQWPVTGEITSYYGWRASPFGGQSRSFHNGIDIANNVGSDIVAAADGTVTQAGWMGAYGRTVTIDHGYGFKTMYGHNYRLLVQEGQQVKKGDVIAALGNSGRSTGPHLHFTIFKYDTPLDPMLFLPE